MKILSAKNAGFVFLILGVAFGFFTYILMTGRFQNLLRHFMLMLAQHLLVQLLLY